jgi:hypothetical protein
MPTVSAVSLAPPSTVGPNTTLTVTYNATFSAHERRLAALLMPIRETFTIQGMDGAASSNIGGPFAKNIAPAGVADSAAVAPVTVGVTSSRLVTRASLQEDPAAGDNDEVRVRIQLDMGLFPLTNVGNSDIETIAG